MVVLAGLFNKTESILIRIIGYVILPDKVKPRKGIYKVYLKYLVRFWVRINNKSQVRLSVFDEFSTKCYNFLATMTLFKYKSLRFIKAGSTLFNMVPRTKIGVMKTIKKRLFNNGILLIKLFKYKAHN